MVFRPRSTRPRPDGPHASATQPAARPPAAPTYSPPATPTPGNAAPSPKDGDHPTDPANTTDPTSTQLPDRESRLTRGEPRGPPSAPADHHPWDRSAPHSGKHQPPASSPSPQCSGPRPPRMASTTSPCARSRTGVHCPQTDVTTSLGSPIRSESLTPRRPAQGVCPARDRFPLQCSPRRGHILI